jgi:hypothetical protein
MNSNIPPVIATHPCIHCGALSQSKDGRCWLCYESKSSPNPFAVSGSFQTDDPVNAPATKRDTVFMVLLGVCVLLTLLIGIGLAVENRGLLIPFAIFLLPAYAVTIISGIASASRNRNPGPASFFFTFVVSLLVTALIAIVLIAAAILFLFLSCMGSVGNWR